MVSVLQQDRELYRCYRLYALDLEMARRSCELIGTHPDEEIRRVLLRDVVIAYARPFKKNRVPPGGLTNLPEAWVPTTMRVLHDQLIGLRDQAIAHSDVEFRNPAETGWVWTPGSVRHILEVIDPEYETLCAQHNEIGDLIDGISSSLNAALRDIEERAISFTRATPGTYIGDGA